MSRAPIPREGLATIAALGLRPEQLPRHVAIIMDGNGRWAAARGLPRAAGHRQGAEAARKVATPMVSAALAGSTPPRRARLAG